MVEASQARGGIRLVAVRDGAVTEATSLETLPALVRDPQARFWLDLAEPSAEVLETVARTLGLHPLIAEDIGERNERAKVEHVGDVIHLVLFALARKQRIEADELDLVLSRRYLLSVHPVSWDPRAAHQLKLGLGPAMERGLDYLLWALVDSVVDGYFPIFDRLADEIDDLQDRVIDKPDRDTLEEVFGLKRELIRIRHVIGPSREIFNQLTNRDDALIGEGQLLYFRDIYDHLVRLTDDFDSARELVAATVEVYLSTINNNLSLIMKRLTGVTVVLAGVGALGGLFGMSEAGPALAGQEMTGFWIVVLVSLVLGAIAVGVLRWIDWV
ncbi:MAG TPA: magnesium transporter CorA family protein [Candidatus Sulfotelmatobacter sp.]|nr:magnesium transporter CorA family protein [Candidatus Sulfotelmatobacter sp.]